VKEHDRPLWHHPALGLPWDHQGLSWPGQRNHHPVDDAALGLEVERSADAAR